MSAAGALIEAGLSALAPIAGMRGYDGQPVQAVLPYAMVEAGPETDWGHKSGAGRELRIAVTIRDGGERPARLRALMVESEQALAEMPPVAGWQLVSFVPTRSRVVGPAKGVWSGIMEYRARLLTSAPA